MKLVRIVIIFTIYFFVIRGASVLLYLFLGDVIIMHAPSYYQLIDTIILAVCLLAAFFYFKKYRQPVSCERNFRFSFVRIGYIILATLAYRVFVDPIFRFDIISGHSIINIPQISLPPLISIIIYFVNIVLLTPVLEELVFRRLILENAVQTMKPIIAILLCSFLFSLDHVGLLASFSMIAIVNALLIGIFLSIIYLEHGIFYSIVSHICFNLFSFIVNVYPNGYWKLIAMLNFGWAYWCLVIGASIFLIRYFVLYLKKW